MVHFAPAYFVELDQVTFRVWLLTIESDSHHILLKDNKIKPILPIHCKYSVVEYLPKSDIRLHKYTACVVHV